MSPPLRPWSEFLAQQVKAPPLQFVHGMRHTVQSGSNCGMHFHREIEIIYHPLGHGTAQMDGQPSIPFREGCVIIHSARELHGQTLDCDGEDFCVQIAPPAFDRLPKTCLYLPHVKNPAAMEDIRLLSLGYPRLSPTEQVIFNLRATALLLDLIHAACTRSAHDTADPSEQHVLKAEEFILNNFSTIGSLQEVAHHVGVSHDYLRHIFKTLRGKPLIRYLNEVRVERASVLLKHSRLPLKQIATMCGFKDEYYFSAVFRRFTRMAPGTYSRKNR